MVNSTNCIPDELCKSPQEQLMISLKCEALNLSLSSGSCSHLA
uniref:Uncharacterized protein n=1 Tax=Arundo donax TaxID=35708 RepID=A0A0A9BKB7_ARUDO